MGNGGTPNDSTSATTVTFEPMTAEAAQILAEALAQIDPWAHYAYTEARLAAALCEDEPGAQHFQIRVEGALAGAMIIRRRWLRGPYLQFLGLLPAFQRHGVGSAALSWFEGQARDDGARNLWVAATHFNVAAQTFYERHGFVCVATLDDLIADGTAEILFRKRLTRE
ncbi:GNAT family N-acetyltransferase [Hyphomicrobium sp.]|uniref:GNAT family N-acetyltransferase n=1 Tax=Hyphomicrobium sp. TaxID=82 RepID=UPI002D79080B|nr:GNAT family N-acetyltransferase [Hyphomicrobium sp.]HET6388187.1 GNAT family N-acetyltransferase [Hyphomicrobium sp.]